MVLLRCLGKMGQVGRRKQTRFRQLAAGSIAPLAQASEPLDVAERKRQSAASRPRTGLSRRGKRNTLAQAGDVLRDREKSGSHRRLRCKNERALRLRSARLLAARYESRRSLR